MCAWAHARRHLLSCGMCGLMRPSLSTLTLSSALVKRRFDMEGGEGRSRRALARGTRPRVESRAVEVRRDGLRDGPRLYAKCRPEMCRAVKTTSWKSKVIRHECGTAARKSNSRVSRVESSRERCRATTGSCCVLVHTAKESIVKSNIHSVRLRVPSLRVHGVGGRGKL